MRGLSGNIYITGFMGSGKTTMGRGLALTLKRKLVDLDEILAREMGMPISQVFAEKGEDAFRAAETRELELLGAESGLVVATGGGAPVSATNRLLMRKSGLILFLDVSLAQCRARLGPQEVAARPLWRDQAAAARLYASRQEAYADCDLRIAGDGLGPEATAQAAAGRLFPRRELTVNLGRVESPVISAWDGTGELARFADGRRVVLLTDRKVARLHGGRYLDVLSDPLVLTVAGGERSKSLATAERLYKEMLKARIGRDDLLVALGGGVVTDLGAYVAATYKRGMGFVLVATTLVGGVDAAVGGKAAVNLAKAKNVVGAFTTPAGVILDLISLGTLGKSQIAEGLAEAYKTGLVADPGLARFIEERLGLLLGGEMTSLARVAAESARNKGKVVTADFREGGLRRILNLGHTYGHALESLANYGVSHGQAVALGLKVAAQISASRGMLDPALNQSIARVVKEMIPLPPPAPAPQAWQLMLNDKKNLGGKVMFVLLRGLGKPLWVEDVTLEELENALKAIKGGVS